MAPRTPPRARSVLRQPEGACRLHPLALVVLLLASCARHAPAPAAVGANLLLVTIDTCRADRLGAYGGPTSATPNLDRLAREGTRFAAAWSAAPLTLPAHATILTGLLPPRHGVRLNGAAALPSTTPTLAHHLRRSGYRTAAFVAAFVLDRRFGLADGCDRYDDEIAAARTQAGLEAERPGREVVERALAWLASGDTRPFFAWVHIYEPHAPYEPPEPFRSAFPADPYEGEVAAADALVGQLFAYLEREKLASRTLVAVMGDPGEALGEHGELTHGLLLYEASLHVPLLLHLPGTVPAAWVVETPVSLADVAPTLAAALGKPMDTAGEPLDGRNLWSDISQRRQPQVQDLYAESRYPATFGWSLRRRFATPTTSSSWHPSPSCTISTRTQASAPTSCPGARRWLTASSPAWSSLPPGGDPPLRLPSTRKPEPSWPALATSAVTTPCPKARSRTPRTWWGSSEISRRRTGPSSPGAPARPGSACNGSSRPTPPTQSSPASWPMNRAIALEVAGRQAEAVGEYRRFLADLRAGCSFFLQRAVAAQLLLRLEQHQ